jgi:predicted nucleotidyltransferase
LRCGEQAVKDRGMDQVEQVVRLISEVVGTDLLGAYLYGSAVLGGLRPASDVDILAVTRRSLGVGQRRALVAGILPISGVAVGARPLELTVVVQADVRPWRYPPIGDFLYGEWLRADYQAGVVPAPGLMPGLALEIAVALTGDHPLAGPRPARILDPVPGELLVRASADGIPGLLADLPHDTRNVLLTFARIWTTLATGTVVAKDIAADWVLARLASAYRPVLAYARELYLTATYAEETWSDELKAQVGVHVDEVLSQIRWLQDTAGVQRTELGGGRSDRSGHG